MAYQAAQTAAASSDAHAVSLKVLRLSRPSLATQTPLPYTSFGDGLDIPPSASLAYPASGDGAGTTSSFPLTPLLTLPASFGAAYVGETFTCTLCANNETQSGGNKSVSAVRIAAELQTPSNKAGTQLELSAPEDAIHDNEDFAPGATIQKTLQHELKEEGPHVLAVTVTYTETMRGSDGVASGGRARTFRKLYQFVSQQLIAVRSKVTARKKMSQAGSRQWVLEAQLENLGETSVVLETVDLSERKGISSVAMNGTDGEEPVILKPQDVEQIMFMLEEKQQQESIAGRLPLAQLHVNWRNTMGERGSLTTGWLASKER